MALGRLAHYELLAKIGQGGMGTVYRARDTRLERLVAIKVLRGPVTTDTERQARFLREARAVARLNHPNIATIYEVGETDPDDPRGSQAGLGGLYIAMEYVEGEDLDDRLLEGPLPWGELFTVGRRIAEGLAAAHQAGVIHRDLKPHNIRLHDHDRVKLLDFGLAKLLEDDVGEPGSRPVSLETRAGMILGTIPYVAPEQLHGRELDERSDLFSLGVVLYQMATGQTPYPVESLARYVRAVLSEAPPPLTEARPDTPAALAHLIERLLGQEPEDRPDSAAQVVETLAALERQETRYGADEDQTRVTGRISGVLPTPRQPPDRSRPASTAPSGAPSHPSSGSRAPGASGTTPPAAELTHSFAPLTPRGRRWGFGLLVLVVALGLAAMLWNLRTGRSFDTTELTTVAVAPFSNLSSAGDEAFCQGIRWDLTERLHEVASILVVETSELDAWRREVRGRPDRGSWGVDVLLNAACRRAEEGETPAIAVQLVDQPTGSVLFSDQASEMGEMAYRLIRALEIPLSEEQRRHLSREATTSVAARKAYLVGLSHLDGALDAEGFEEAADQFREALDQDPRFAAAWAGLAEASWELYNQTQDSVHADAADRAARRAMELDPELPAARIARAHAHRGRGELEDAEALLEALLEEDSNSAAVHAELANLHRSAGHLERAESYQREALELRPYFWRYWNQLGSIAQRATDLDGARASYQRALELAPPEARSWPLQNLASLELQAGDPAAALEAYDRIEGPITDPDLASNRGMALFLLGRHEEAADNYRQALELGDQRPEPWGNLGDLLELQGKSEEARQAWNQAAARVQEELEVNPKDVWAQSLAVLYDGKLGRCEAVTRRAADHRDRFTSNATHLSRLAKAQALCDRPSEALAAIRAALDLGAPAGAFRGVFELRNLEGDPAYDALLSDPPRP